MACPSPVGPTRLRGLGISNGCQDHTTSPYADASFVLRAVASLTGFEKNPPCDRCSAAYLAGLAAGVYPEPAKFADNWRLEHRFKPNMSEATRQRKLAGWARAVKGLLASDEGVG